jgi:hypothetical protein
LLFLFLASVNHYHGKVFSIDVIETNQLCCIGFVGSVGWLIPDVRELFLFFFQHSSLLVKNTSLVLLILITKRADDLLKFFRKDTSAIRPASMNSGSSFVDLFTDTLIKALPDVKTIISLRQNLVAKTEQKQDQSKNNKQERTVIRVETLEEKLATPESKSLEEVFNQISRKTFCIW